MFFSRAKKGAQTFAVIDVGSCSVGAAVVSVAEPGVVPRYTFHTSAREELWSEASLSPEEERSRLLTATDAVLKTVSNGAPRPQAAHVLLRAPYYSGTVHTVRVQGDQAQAITKQALGALIANEEKTFLQGGVLPLWNEGEKRVLERMLLSARIEGYRVANPIAVAAKNKEYSLYFSLAQAGFVQELSARVSAPWHLSQPFFYSYPRALCSAINTVLPTMNNYLVLSIGGEYSELTLIWHDALIETIGIPLGKNQLFRSALTALGTTVPELRSTLNALIAGTLERSVAEKLSTVLTTVQGEWLRALTQALSTLMAERYLPETVFILSDEASVTELFSRSFKSTELAALSVGDTSFKTVSLQSLLTQETRISADPALLLFTVFCATLALLPRGVIGDPAGL